MYFTLISSFVNLLDFYDLKYIIKAYKNRTKYNKYIKFSGVKIGNKYLQENEVLNYLLDSYKVKSFKEIIKKYNL